MAGRMALEEGKPLVEERKPAPTTGCCGCCPAPRHIDDAFVDKYLDGDVQWGYWKLPPRNPQTLEEQRMKLIDREAFPATSVIKTESTMERGFASAKDMMDILYQATKAPGITEKVPEHLRGVYWMKDNGVGEELVVVQWGQWFEEEGVLLVPMATFMWAWPDGIPTNAPFGGIMYGPQTTVTGARVLLGSGKPPPDKNSPGCLSFKFNRDMSYGTLQGHFHDVRDDTVDLGTFIPFCPCCSCVRGLFTMELLDSESTELGSRYKRGIWWGLGSFTPIEFGSYTLTKVMKGNGEPNEPYYSEFVEYMGDVRLFTWSGFVDEPEQAPMGCGC